MKNLKITEFIIKLGNHHIYVTNEKDDKIIFSLDDGSCYPFGKEDAIVFIKLMIKMHEKKITVINNVEDLMELINLA